MGWYTPQRMLLLCCALNFLNYVERGNIASTGVNGRFENSTCASDLCGGSGQPERDAKGCRDLCGYTGIQGEFRLDNGQNGLLASLFTVGLTVASPPSAHLIKFFHPFTVILAGQTIFTAALVLCGFAENFTQLLLFRTMVGGAEPSFIVVAPAYLIEAAPEGKRARWLAYFYLCLPVGTAAGYGYGGLFEGVDWRWSYRVQAVLNFPFVLFLLLAERVDLRPARMQSAASGEGGRLLRQSQVSASESVAEAMRDSVAVDNAALRRSVAHSVSAAGAPPRPQSLWDDLRTLRTVRFGLLCGGLSCYYGYFGGIAFWGPKAGGAMYPEIEDNSDFLFSVMAFVSGLFGTFVGGYLLDWMGSSFRSAMKLCCMASFCGTFFSAACLWTPPNDPNVVGFFAFKTLGLFTLFVAAAPASAGILWSVTPELRPTGMAVATLVLHCAGDVPSPYYYGAVQDGLNDWRLTFSIFVPLLLVASAFWAAAALRAGPDEPAALPASPRSASPRRERPPSGGALGRMGDGEGLAASQMTTAQTADMANYEEKCLVDRTKYEADLTV